MIFVTNNRVERGRKGNKNSELNQITDSESSCRSGRTLEVEHG